MNAFPKGAARQVQKRDSCALRLVKPTKVNGIPPMKSHFRHLDFISCFHTIWPAYNPSVSPLHSALVNGLVNGLGDWGQLRHVMLAEPVGACVKHEHLIRECLKHICPQVEVKKKTRFVLLS